MRRPLLAVCLCLLLVTAICLLSANSSGGLLKGQVQEEDTWQESVLAACEGEEITVTGQVYQKDEKYYYIDSVQILENAAGLQQEKSTYYNFIIERPQGSNALLGSVIAVQGTFYSFEKATNPGEFDGAEYYTSIGIDGRMWEIKLLGSTEEYSLIKETLYSLREYFKNRLYRIFPQKEASVMCTILLGEKQGLDADIKALYQRNGIVHILSISGLHISIIGMSLFKLLKKAGVPVWLAAICGGAVLCLYGVMTGMGVSACRAIGMYLIRMLGVCLGRTYDMMTAWGVVGVLMIFDNPYYLTNCGFLLSYASILGIGVLFPILKQMLEEATEEMAKRRGKNGAPGMLRTQAIKMVEEQVWKEKLNTMKEKLLDGLQQSMLAGTSVTLMTLPIMLWFYYEVPVFSILLNLVVIPLMDLLMVTGLIAMLVPGLGIVGTIDVLILKWYEICCELFEMLPFHMWNPGRPAVWQVLVYYGILFGFMGGYVLWKDEGQREEGSGEVRGRIREHISGKIKSLHFLIVGILAAIVMIVVLSMEIPNGHTVTFLDVGQGDCICLQTDNGQVYLFDCGSTSRSEVGTYVLKPFLKYYGISRIDAIFISHSDADHCNGIEELIANRKEWGITIENLVVSECDEEIYEQYKELVEAAAEGTEKAIKDDATKKSITNWWKQTSAIQIRQISAGDAWEIDGIEFWCLHPTVDFETEDTNAASQCFYVDFGNQSMLLTGDVEEKGEEALLEEIKDLGIQDITVLKVAHHGSRYSTSAEFLEQLRPQVAVISCSKNNSYGHPHEDTLKRLEDAGSRVLSTPEYGAITIEADKEMKVYGFTSQ